MSAERNAQKEIKEETGMEVDELILLGGGMTDGSEKITYFLAKCSGRIHLEDEEGIKQCLLVDANKMGEMILNGEIGDRYTMKAFLYAKLRNIL
jgi:hypothetical protein